VGKREHNEAVVRRVINDIFNKGQHELVRECYDPDCIIRDSAAPGELTGLDSIIAVMDSYRAAIPDAHYQINRLVHDGDTVAVHWIASGTLLGSLWGQAPSGRTFRLPAVAIIELKNGMLTTVEQVWDAYGMCNQLGICPPQKLGSRALLRSWFDDAWCQADASDADIDAVIDRYWADDAAIEGTHGAQTSGRESIRDSVHQFRRAFSDVVFELSHFHDEQGEVGCVVRCAAMHRATGKPITLRGHMTATVVNGRFSSGHSHFDFLNVLAQLDALPNDMLARCLSGDQIGFVDS
jgi:steroid delta-isomerase-like uncharacterized protein